MVPDPSPRQVAIHALRRWAGVFALPLVAAVGPLGAASAQPLAQERPDSAAARAAAREAQGRFERERLRRVARDRSGFSGGACDERVGRMCMFLEGRSDWWWPVTEDPELTAAREHLIEALAAAADHAPGDPWIVGQRVVYLGEAGRWPEALSVARDCRLRASERWWCDALEGLALQVTGHYEESEDAFDRALAAMPAEEARRWRSVDVLLDGEGDSGRKRAVERGDSAALERFWRLSDPLFLVPGSDRRTEHFARRAWAVTREGARNPYAMSWGWDLDELLIRYGWEVGWQRRDPGMGSIGVGTSAVGHQDPRSQGFVAPAAVWDGSPDTDREDWNPGSRRRPRTGYAPAYAPTFLDLDAHVAVLPRGDSAVLVVRAPGLPADTTFHARHGHTSAPDPTDLPVDVRRHGLFAAGLDGSSTVRGVSAEGLEGSLRLTVPSGDHVVSVEVWDAEARTAARMRRGLRVPRVPRDVAALSDLLLGRARGPLPDSLEGFLPDLIATATVAPGDTLRVAWEVHGLGWRPREPLAYTLTVEEGAGGLFTRLGRTLGVVGDRRGTRLAWTEQGPFEAGPLFRAVDVVLPPELDEGDFRLRVELVTEGRSTLVAEREVRVEYDPSRR